MGARRAGRAPGNGARASGPCAVNGARNVDASTLDGVGIGEVVLEIRLTGYALANLILKL